MPATSDRDSMPNSCVWPPLRCTTRSKVLEVPPARINSMLAMRECGMNSWGCEGARQAGTLPSTLARYVQVRAIRLAQQQGRAGGRKARNRIVNVAGGEHSTCAQADRKGDEQRAPAHRLQEAQGRGQRVEEALARLDVCPHACAAGAGSEGGPVVNARVEQAGQRQVSSRTCGA